MDDEEKEALEEALRNAVSNLFNTYQKIGELSQEERDDPESKVGYGVFTVGVDEQEFSIAIHSINTCFEHLTFTIIGVDVANDEPMAVSMHLPTGDFQVWDPSADEYEDGHPGFH